MRNVPDRPFATRAARGRVTYFLKNAARILQEQRAG